MKINNTHSTIILILNNLKKHIYLTTALCCIVLAVTSFCFHRYITPFFYVPVICIFVLAGMYIYAKTGFERKKLPKLTAAVFLCCLILCVTIYLLERKTDIIKFILFIFLFFIAVYLFFKKKLTCKNIMILLFVCGILLRVTAVLANEIDTKQHDVGDFSIDTSVTYSYDNNKEYTLGDRGAGHSGYIEYIFHNMSLPDFDIRNIWSFYNPPLFHIIAAIWLRIAVLSSPNYVFACETIKIIPLYCSIVTMIFAYKLFRTLGLKKHGMIAASAIVTFSNAFVMLSYNVNNDPMATMFTVGSVLYCVKWYKKQNFKNIILSALLLGLGMMTKLSSAVVAPAIAFIFVYTFFKNKKYKKYLLQFASFLAVSVPLGLWYPVRNYIQFGIPITYVQTIDSALSEQSLSNVPVLQRLFGFDISMFNPPWVHTIGFGDYTVNESNPLTGLLKTSVFEEFYQNNTPISIFVGIILLICVIILGAVGFIKMIMTLFRKDRFSKKITDIFFVVLYFSMMISYYIFCLKNPYSCSQHIRYVSAVVVIGAFYVGQAANSLSKKKNTTGKVMFYSLYSVIIAFCIMSIQI